MYILLQNLKALPGSAQYLYYDTSKPIKYIWQRDFTNFNKIGVKHIAAEQNEAFIPLRNLLAFYSKRDDVKLKILARGKTLQRLFERYPEILL